MKVRFFKRFSSHKENDKTYANRGIFEVSDSEGKILLKTGKFMEIPEVATPKKAEQKGPTMEVIDKGFLKKEKKEIKNV